MDSNLFLTDFFDDIYWQNNAERRWENTDIFNSLMATYGIFIVIWKSFQMDWLSSLQQTSQNDWLKQFTSLQLDSGCAEDILHNFIKFISFLWWWERPGRCVGKRGVGNSPRHKLCKLWSHIDLARSINFWWGRSLSYGMQAAPWLQLAQPAQCTWCNNTQ